VQQTTYRRSGGRVVLLLDDGSELALRLFWPRRALVAALLSMRDDERVGWIVEARTVDGSDLTYYAWLATVTPPGARRR
jgi:hypothetical protein